MADRVHQIRGQNLPVKALQGLAPGLYKLATADSALEGLEAGLGLGTDAATIATTETQAGTGTGSESSGGTG